MKRLITYIILISFGQTSVQACDCIPTSEKFIDKLENRQLVIHARVIGHTEKPDGHFNIHNFEGITKLSVLHSFKGKLWTDTLVHINTSNAMCGSSIQGLEVNQEVFLKAYLTYDFWKDKSVNYSDDTKRTTKSDSIILNYGKRYQNIQTLDCDASIIPVIAGKAKGRITRNVSRQLKRYRKLEKCNPEKAEEYFSENIRGKDTSQQISVRKMYAIIRKQINPS